MWRQHINFLRRAFERRQSPDTAAVVAQSRNILSTAWKDDPKGTIIALLLAAGQPGLFTDHPDPSACREFAAYRAARLIRKKPDIYASIHTDHRDDPEDMICRAVVRGCQDDPRWTLTYPHRVSLMAAIAILDGFVYDAVRRLLKSDESPLVAAAVKMLTSIYSERLAGAGCKGKGRAEVKAYLNGVAEELVDSLLPQINKQAPELAKIDPTLAASVIGLAHWVLRGLRHLKRPSRKDAAIQRLFLGIGFYMNEETKTPRGTMAMLVGGQAGLISMMENRHLFAFEKIILHMLDVSVGHLGSLTPEELVGDVDGTALLAASLDLFAAIAGQMAKHDDMRRAVKDHSGWVVRRMASWSLLRPEDGVHEPLRGSMGRCLTTLASSDDVLRTLRDQTTHSIGPNCVHFFKSGLVGVQDRKVLLLLGAGAATTVQEARGMVTDCEGAYGQVCGPGHVEPPMGGEMEVQQEEDMDV